jgi:hypothetical protein
MNLNTACDLVCDQALVMMSAAEQAIVRAQGGPNTNRGPCWGCDGLPMYQANSFSHIWMDCPHKAVLEVRKNAQKNLKQFLLNRKSILSDSNDRKPAASKATSASDVHTVLSTRAEELKTKWEAEGHPSYEKAALLVSIVDPTTDKKVRQVCYQALTRGTKRNAQDAEYAASAKMPPGSHPGTSNRPMTFVGIPVPPAPNVSTFQAGVIPVTQKSVFHLSQIMPHASIAIGLRGTGNIIAMVDSGSGCSIGRLTYHKSIAEAHQDLVANFEWIPDEAQIGIGGVDAQGTPIKISAIITYHTPYRCDGQPIQLSLGLSQHVSANTILGIPFLRQSHCSIMMNTDNSKESLVCSRFGQVLPLIYQPPHCADEAPLSGLNMAGGTFALSPLVNVKMDPKSSSTIIKAIWQLSEGIKHYFMNPHQHVPVMIGWNTEKPMFVKAQRTNDGDGFDLEGLYELMENQACLDEQLYEAKFE